MRWFEILFLGALLLVVFRFRLPAAFRLRGLIGSLVLLLPLGLHLVFEGWRWQLVPAYLIVLPALWWLQIRASPKGWRFTLVTLAMCFVCFCSGLLAWGLPVFRIPEPGGAFPIGSTQVVFEDVSRDEWMTSAVGDKRRLSVRFWYPTSDVGKSNRLPYWPSPPIFSKTLTDYSGLPNILAHLKYVRGHALMDVPARAGKWPVVVFSHGLANGHIYQNTHLFQELASHGYVVVSVGHTYQTLVAEFGSEFVRVDTELDGRFMAELDEARPERARASEGGSDQVRWLKAQYDKQPLINRCAETWALDQMFVIDRLHAGDHPELARVLGDRLDLDRIGTMGMSFGGCAAGEVALRDPRVKAGVNLDGYHFGRALLSEGVEIPFMIMQAVHKNETENNFFFEQARAPAYRVYVRGTTHLSYTDIILFGPLIRQTGLVGDIEPHTMLDIIADHVRLFFDEYLLGKPGLLSPERPIYREVDLHHRNVDPT